MTATTRGGGDMTKRREFTKAQKAQIVHRATNANGHVVCEGCGLVLGKKSYEIDHKLAEGLVVDKTKPLTIEDGELLGVECCHRGPDGKTNQDVKAIAKAKRCEAKDMGIRKPSSFKSRGFTPAPPQRRASRPIEKWKGF
jgi:hypothetical protein